MLLASKDTIYINKIVTINIVTVVQNLVIIVKVLMIIKIMSVFLRSLKVFCSVIHRLQPYIHVLVIFKDVQNALIYISIF